MHTSKLFQSCIHYSSQEIPDMASNQVSGIHSHGVVVDTANKKVKCNYCGKIVSNGFYRLKYHLGGVKGDVAPCLIVPEPVKLEFRNELEKKKGKGKVLPETDLRELVQQHFQAKRKSDCLEIKPYSHDTDAQIDRVLGQLTNPIPSDEELRRLPLNDTLDEINEHLNEIKVSWENTGCSILLDTWAGLQERTLINILVNCPKGTIYMRSCYVSTLTEDVDDMQLLIEKVIQDVGSKNIVQIITNSTYTLMEVARKKIMAKHRHIFWTINVSTCIDLMRERFVEIPGKQIVTPFLQELNSFTENNKPQMGYIYQRIDELKETIKQKLKNKMFQYVPFWYAIDEVWNNHLHSHLHSAGYYLNPHLFYSNNFYCDPEVATGLSDCIVRMSEGDYSTRRSIRLQVVEYLMKKRSSSESDMNRPPNSCPVMWWSKNEREYPELSRMAIRILSQTCDGASKFKLDRKLAEMLIYEKRPTEKQLRTNYAFVCYNMKLQNFDSEISGDDIGPSNNQKFD